MPGSNGFVYGVGGTLKEPPMSQPLTGLIVLDFSTLLPGPMASLFLAEAGATVIKIERPGSGEDMRAYPPLWGPDGMNFALLNRGKHSIAIDLKDAGQRARLMPLIERCDVIIEQFRPGVMARLGLDYQTVARINPKVIYCSITGYGQTGPKRDVAGHDLNYIGDTGLLALSMGTAAAPSLPPALLADIAGGTYPAVLNILLALHDRTRTGRGCALDIAMTDNLLPFMFWAIGGAAAAGQWPGNGTDLFTGGSPRYRLYPARDGRRVAVAALEDKFWATFCVLIDLDAEFRSPICDPGRATAAVAALIACETGDYWRGRFAGRDCCCSVVADLREALADPHFQARGLFQHTLTNGAGATLPALPVPIAPQFRGVPDRPQPAPPLGAHNGTYLGRSGTATDPRQAADVEKTRADR
jgi:alpha-methylacyl-CoA racemase